MRYSFPSTTEHKKIFTCISSSNGRMEE